MSTAWVAAGVRARAMSRRRLGRAATRALARRDSLELALDDLTTTPYDHDVHPGQDLGAAQNAVAATVLWHMRVLAGWVPRGDAQILRLLAGGFEAANVDERLKALMGSPTGPEFRLGSLATAWQAIAPATSIAEVRLELARSAWGDPGADTAAAVRLSMRLSWALRVLFGVPDEKWGETPVAFVIPVEPGAVDADELRKWVNGRVEARYQRVSRVVIVDDFPRSAAGKTLKRVMRDDFVKG